MNYFSNNKVLMWVLLVLLVLNISTIGTIIYHVYYDKDEPVNVDPSTETPLFLKERMNLDDRQWGNFRRMHDEFRSDSRELFREMDQIRKEILEEVMLENPRKERLYELAEAYGERHALLKKNTVDHFLGMRKNIRPEQERMMNMFLRNMMEHEGMRRGRGPGAGHRERHRSGGGNR